MIILKDFSVLLLIMQSFQIITVINNWILRLLYWLLPSHYAMDYSKVLLEYSQKLDVTSKLYATIYIETARNYHTSIYIIENWYNNVCLGILLMECNYLMILLRLYIYVLYKACTRGWIHSLFSIQMVSWLILSGSYFLAYIYLFI